MALDKLYQETGQMAAGDEDAANILREWLEKRRYYAKARGLTR